MNYSINKFVITLSLTLLLSACVNRSPEIYQNMSYADFHSQVTFEDTQFDKDITVQAPYIFTSKFAEGRVNYLLRGWKDKNGKNKKHQVYANIGFSEDWHYYNRASDDSSKSLELLEISTDVDCNSDYCALEETVGINISDRYLRNKSSTGLLIQISSKAGYDKVVSISANYIRHYLKAFDEYRAK